MTQPDVILKYPPHPPISESHLPYELEREICGIAAYNFPRCVPNLILTARRFRIWFEPELYRIIRSGLGRVIPPLDVSQLNADGEPCVVLDMPRIRSFGRHVQHVLLQKRSPAEIAKILECCPNVSNLALWVTQGTCTSLLPILEKLPLRKLSLDPSYFFPDVCKNTGFPFDQPLFHNLTHFQIINATSAWWRWQKLALSPKLTHLSLGNVVHQLSVDLVLEQSPNLELFVMFSYADRVEESETEPTTPQKDVRVVILNAIANPLDEWEKGARGEGNFWQKAQGIKEERIRKRLAYDGTGITSVLVEL